VGGELDAYTTKEETALYASFLSEYYPRAIELLNDIVFNSVFPAKELQKEKFVICDEINSYKDNPSELIFDEFESLLFENHELGKSILGTENTVKSIQVSQIEKYIKRCFSTDNIVFTSVGNISFKKLLSLCQNTLQTNTKSTRNSKREKFIQSKRFTITHSFNTYQAHCLMGNTAYSYCNDKRLALIVLSNILAGPAMNSRLNLLLREKHGITYNIESVYTPYTETGSFMLYYGTDEKNISKCRHLIEKEISTLCNNRLGTLQLSKAKKQIMGQLALGFEIHSNLMLSIGKSYLLFNEVEDIGAMFSKIDQITANDLMDAANEVLYPEKLSTLIYS